MDSYQKLSPDSARMSKDTSLLLLLLAAQPIPLQTELSCLSKISDHPFVDTAGGVAKVRERATAESHFEEGTADRLSDLAKVQFCRAYYAKKRRWPKMTRAARVPLTSPR